MTIGRTDKRDWKLVREKGDKDMKGNKLKEERNYFTSHV
jgi:hypothetical protein